MSASDIKMYIEKDKRYVFSVAENWTSKRLLESPSYTYIAFVMPTHKALYTETGIMRTTKNFDTVVKKDVCTGTYYDIRRLMPLTEQSNPLFLSYYYSTDRDDTNMPVELLEYIRENREALVSCNLARMFTITMNTAKVYIEQCSPRMSEWKMNEAKRLLSFLQDYADSNFEEFDKSLKKCECDNVELSREVEERYMSKKVDKEVIKGLDEVVFKYAFVPNL